MNKEQSRQRWRELRDLVNTWDPIGLIAIGAPQDEYECVVAPVLRLLEQGASQEAIVSYLAGECSDHFGAPIAESSAREFAARAKTWYQLRWQTPGRTGDESEVKAADFYLGSSDSRGDFARARAAWARKRLTGPNDGEYLWIRVEPPVIGQAFGLGEKDLHDLIVSPHLQGSTLFPINEFPMHVYIYRALTDRVFETLRFDKVDVVMQAWGELYRTFESAAAAAL